MATKSQSERWGEPQTITIEEMAHALSRDPVTIREYVKKHEFPPPKLQPGERKPLWMRDHFKRYIATGQWPQEAFPSVKCW